MSIEGILTVSVAEGMSIGSIVYVRSDEAQLRRQITGYMLRDGFHFIAVAHVDEEALYQPVELSTERTVL